MFSQDKQRQEPEKQKTAAGKSKQKRKRKGMTLDDRPLLEPNAAGIDIGAREIFVAVPADRDENPVRVFPTFTADLEEMARWLVSCRVTTVAMESIDHRHPADLYWRQAPRCSALSERQDAQASSPVVKADKQGRMKCLGPVYWIPLYDVLERHGVTACLVNARNMKNVPGRRTDWHECQWLQFLHSVGLLRAAFRPDADVSAVRSLMRHRTDLVQIAAQHIQHMQKSLTQMNLQIHHVISEITGVTGLAIVDAIIEGERDPAVLAKLRDHCPGAQTHGHLVLR